MEDIKKKKGEKGHMSPVSRRGPGISGYLLYIFGEGATHKYRGRASEKEPSRDRVSERRDPYFSAFDRDFQEDLRKEECTS